MLRVPVIVRAKMPDGESLEEQSYTSVVNAHGGLLNLQRELLVGQPIVLVNAQTKKEHGARVVRVENPPGGHIAVAFEFDKPSPQFWPVVFPPGDWTTPKT
jgi:hypothetical protein